MADTTALKNRIRAAVKVNGNQEITGPVLQQALLDMVDELNGATETEASQRQNGDSTLQQGINTERQARIDADSALGQRIITEIQQERQRAEEAFDDLDMIDAASSQVSPEAIDLTLRKNDGSDQDPEWRTLCNLLIPSATNQRAGLMSAAMRNILYNLKDVQQKFLSYLCQPYPFGYTLESYSANYSGTTSQGCYKTNGQWVDLDFLRTTDFIVPPSGIGEVAYVSAKFPRVAEDFNTLNVFDLDGNYVTGYNISDREVVKLSRAYKYKFTVDDISSIKLWITPLSDAGIKNRSNVIYRRAAFGLIEDFSKSYVKGTGTEVQGTNNKMMYSNITNGEPNYTIKDFQGAKVFEVSIGSGSGNWAYVYISGLYQAARSAINSDSFINAALLDISGNVIYVGILKYNIIMVPRNCTLILCGSSDAIVMKDCTVENSVFPVKKALSEKGKLTPSQEQLNGHVVVSRVGQKIQFAEWEKHCVYENLDPNKTYGIKCSSSTGTGGKGFGFAITDENDIVLQVISNGQIVPTGFVGTNTIYFKQFYNQAKIYASYADNAECVFYDTNNILDVQNAIDDAINTSKVFTQNAIDDAINTSKVFTKGMVGTLYERLSFGVFEAFGMNWVPASGTEVQPTYENKMMYFSLDSNGEPSYTLRDFNGSYIYEIERGSTGDNWGYVYVQGLFGVIRNTIQNSGFINAVMLDSNNKVIAASVLHHNVIRMPKNSKLIICTADSGGHVRKNCSAVSNPARIFFATKDFICDGDSMVGWPSYTNAKLGFKTMNSNSMGNATCRDRTASAGGTTYYPQWAPDCTEQNPFIDYKDINTYEEGSAERAQATANNCLYGHLGRLIKVVSDGGYPTPNIFVMNIMGVNDTWTTGSIDSIVGTFEDAITGSYDQIQRNTILNSVRWFVTKFRKTFPNCKLFWKTSTQQTADNHTYFYNIEEPLLKLLRFLSVPVIDSYAEVGIMRELEHANSPAKQENQWTGDGTHPTSAGYQMDGEFVASKLKAWFSCYFD